MITLKSFQILKSLRKNSIEYQFINLSKDQLNILLPQKIGRDTLFFFKFCSPLQFVSFNIHNFFSSFFFFHLLSKNIQSSYKNVAYTILSLSLSLNKHYRKDLGVLMIISYRKKDHLCTESAIIAFACVYMCF